MRSLAILLLLPALLGLVLTGCSASESTQKQELDDAIHVVEQALGRYMSTDPQGPASQLGRVTDRVVSAWDGVRSAAAGLDEVDLAAAEAALAELVGATDQVPEELTAREGFELIEPVVEAFEAEVDEIHESLDMH
jgi:hypothetical protein